MIIDTLKINGQLQITLYDENMNIKEYHAVPNLVVDSGKALVASRLVGNAHNPITHMIIGIGSTKPTKSDTALNIALDNGCVPIESITVNANEIMYYAVFGVGKGVGTIVEAGMFNSSINGTMISRTTFPPVEKTEHDMLSIIWKITIT